MGTEHKLNVWRRLALAIVVTSVITTPLSAQRQPEQTARIAEERERGTLRWHAAQARAKGKDQVVLQHGFGNPPVIAGLADALSTYSALVVRPLASMSYAENSRTIMTLYRCQVVEILSTASTLPVAPTVTDIPDEPKRMLPLGPGEMWILRNGGTVTVDGIVLTDVNEVYPQFSTQDNYLIFAASDAAGTIASIPMESDGVFKLTLDDQLRPWGRAGHAVVSQMQSLHRNSLASLRRQARELRMRPVSPQR